MDEKETSNIIKVTIGLVDGEVATGFIRYFTPFTLHLQIWPDTCRDPSLPEDKAVFLPTEHIAYLAQYRKKGEEIAKLEGDDIEEMKVQLAGGHRIQVKVSTSTIHNPTGFTGIPADPNSPFRLYYFYGHAIYTKENPNPIGKMLIAEGHVDEQGVEAGVEFQRQVRQSEKQPTPPTPQKSLETSTETLVEATQAQPGSPSNETQPAPKQPVEQPQPHPKPADESLSPKKSETLVKPTQAHPAKQSNETQTVLNPPAGQSQPLPKTADESVSPQKVKQTAQVKSTPTPKTPAQTAPSTLKAPAPSVSNKPAQKKDNIISHPMGQVLVQEGLISNKELNEAIAKQKQARSKRLGQVLVDLGMINEETLYRTLAKKFHLPFVDLDKTPINQGALDEIHIEILNKHLVLPIDSDNKNLLVAISDPLDMDVYDVLRFQVKKHITQALACPSQINARLFEYKPKTQQVENEMAVTDLIRDLSAEEPDEAEDETDVVQASSDSAIVKLANQIIVDAYNRGASDIHIEPRGKRADTVIRFRVDGRCSTYQTIPAKSWRSLVARYKIISGLDIAERRKPQDGKIVLRRPEGKLELRVATIPMVEDNEAIVLRILASSKPLPLGKMGLSSRNLDELLKIMQRPYGLFLCVGPTGSGKTTTLHSSLGEINKPERKIWTAEDPVEITQAGLCQVQVRPNIGYTFAAAMRAFLRADPDVIMIGEMRDQETASIAVEASLTGHLVISTLHTNSAPETITRLLDMGLDPFSFSDALAGVLAQRLARRLCTECRQVATATQKEYDTLAKLYGPERFSKLVGNRHTDLQLYSASGCSQCGNSGYKGRLAIHELLVSNDEIKVAIERRAPVSELRELAMKAGMNRLLMDGIEKCLQGITDLKQVQAVCTA